MVGIPIIVAMTTSSTDGTATWQLRGLRTLVEVTVELSTVDERELNLIGENLAALCIGTLRDRLVEENGESMVSDIEKMLRESGSNEQ